MRMSLATKLSLGIIALWLPMAAVFVAVWDRVRSALDAVDRMAHVAAPAGDAAIEMEVNLLGTGFAALGYLDDPDSAFPERIRDDQEDFERFQGIFHELNLYLTPVHKYGIC